MPLSDLKPAAAAHIQAVIEERLAAVSAQQGPKETVTIEWRGQQMPIEVIAMPLELLYYNPVTHRLRAQRTLDAERDHELEADPFGNAGQAYLHSLLMGDPASPSKVDPTFDALKADLSEHGQTEPGITTRQGVLINGNTRRAALRELNQQYMRVGVLPPDAGLDDLQAIELSLQLRRDHKRDYSFMNFLLAIEERVRANRKPAEIQRDFRIKSVSYERAVWILAFVREAIERSTVEIGGNVSSLRLVDFETHQGKMEELYTAYMKRKATDPDAAEALREQRLLALVLDKSKTDLRLIEPDFASSYLKDYIPQTDTSDDAPSVPGRTIPGTTIKAAPRSKSVQALREATDRVLKARTLENLGSAAPPTLMIDAGQTLTQARSAFNAALDKAGKNGRVLKKRLGPSERLSDANDDLELCVQAVADARATGNFQPEDLDEQLASLRDYLEKLAQLASRGGYAPGGASGVDWLRKVASISESDDQL